MTLTRYHELLAAGPEITRSERKRLRGWVLTPTRIAMSVLAALYGGGR